MPRRLPRGRVTFAFVDVVESTRTFAEHGDAFVVALGVLQEQIARHTEAVAGAVVKTEGDGAFLAFPDAHGAVAALVALQEELAQLPADTVPRLRVRAGAHTGDAVPVADDYVALAVNVAARVTSTVGAGQVVVSAATHTELGEPIGVCVGDYDLKDVADPVELWRVCGDDTPLRGSPSRRTNVSVPVTGFVGREIELAELEMLTGRQRLVTVLGPGGLGKTRLVSELVLGIAGGIAGGAWLVELATLSAGDQVPGAVAAVLGVQVRDGAAIAAELRRRGPVLLVLDNCEHLLDAVADLVGELQEACPELTVLCTSREPLQVPGEHVWRLGPFAGQAARLELFTQRAWASGGVVTDESVESVDRLCNALDGLPLAIELAATQAGSTSVDELVRIAEQGTDDLARRGGAPRQRSLDAVLSWSLDRLPAARRASLLVLSTLPGRFDLDLATGMLGTIEQCETGAVRPLTRASLVDLDGESYRLLDTIKHAARRRLTGDPELAAAARTGLRVWALRAAAERFRSTTRHDVVSVDRFLALESALAQGVADGAVGLGRLWDLVRLMSFYREPSSTVTALARDLVLGERVPHDDDEVLCFTNAFQILLLTRQPLDVLPDRLEEIAAAADALGASYGSGYLHIYLTFWYTEYRHDEASARRHAEAYAPFAESDDASPVDRNYLHLVRSWAAAAQCATEESLHHAEQYLAAALTLDHEIDLETAHCNLADALFELGRAEEAVPFAVTAARLTKGAGPQRRYALHLLARTQAAVGDLGAAHATVEEYGADLRASGWDAAAIEAELAEVRANLTAPPTSLSR